MSSGSPSPSNGTPPPAAAHQTGKQQAPGGGGEGQPSAGQRPEKPERPAMPRRPTPAKEDEAATKRRGCLAVLMAGMLVLLCLVGLAFLSQGYMIPVVMITGGVFLYVFFHYIVWGWWLGSIIREEARQEEEAKAALQKAENPPR